MIYCSKCGAAHPDEARECACGFRLFNAPPALPVTAFRCTAEGGRLLLLYLKTLLLSIVTLGIYSFWGRAEIRRYLASETWAGEDRFENYTTGAELFKGWLKAAGVLAVFYAVFILLSLSHPKYGPAIGMAFFYLGIMALVPFAIVGSTRYRMSRTAWRGIRFSSTAQYGEFAKLYYKGLLLTMVTLGFYMPWFISNVSGYITRTSQYGDRSFSYDGHGRDLLKPYIIFILLLIPTLYMIGFWFAAKQTRYIWNRTTFAGARFECTLRGRQLLWLAFSNGLLIVCTLGFGIPWAVLRTIRLQCSTLTLHGELGLETVHQRAMAATATGEGVASVFDIDADAGAGFGI